MTYFPSLGEPVVYRLNAARSVAQRENVPKTLEQIRADTYADPNPFPPITPEIVLIFLSPTILLAFLVAVFHFMRRRRKKRAGTVPRPVSRHLK